MQKFLVQLLISLSVFCSALGADCQAYKDRLDESRKNQSRAQMLSYLEQMPRENPGDPCIDYTLGLMYHARRDYERSHQSFQRAIQLAEKANDPLAQAQTKIALAVLYLQYGNPDKALKYLSEAADLSKEKLDVRGTALMRMAEALLDLGELDDAEKKCYEALDALKAVRAAGVGYVYNLLGDTRLAAGDEAVDPSRADSAYGKAIAHYTQAYNVVVKPGPKLKLRVSLADAHLKLGSQEEALGYYESFLKEAPPQNPFLEDHSRAHGGIAQIYLQRGDYDRALFHLQRAAELAKEDQYRLLEMSWAKLIGDVYAAQGDYAAARAQYDKVLETVKDGFLDLGSKSGDEYVFFPDVFRVYEGMVALLLRMGRAAEAFDYLERARDQSMLQTLFRSRIVDKLVQGASEEKFRADLQRLQAAVTQRHQTRLEKYERMKNQSPEEIRRLQTEIERLEAEIGDLYRDMVHLIRGLLRGRDRSNLVGQLQAEVLKKNETLIEYLVTDEATFVFVVAKDAFYHEVIPIGRKGYKVTGAGKKEAMDSLSQRLRDVSPCLFPFPGEDASHCLPINELSAYIQPRALETLYKTIFRPIEPHLRPDHQLIIVPDDALYYLPFEMLVTQLAPRAYLLAKYPISYSYSAGLLLELAKTPYTPPQTSLLIGNPDFGPAATANETVRSGLASSRFLVGEHLPPLRYAQEEVRRLRSLIGNTEMLVGVQATEAAFKKKARDAVTIHIASHSFFNRRNYLDSNIVFALDKKINQRDGEDGVLYLHEIMNLKLNALLVTLTGCETGLGRVRRGGGLEGLSRAFLTAGVPSVMGTLWPVVDSQPTSQLMARFYQYLTRGLNKREALRQAKLDLLAENPNADPFLWAPAVLIGDMQAIKIAANSRFLRDVTANSWFLIIAILILSLLALLLFIYGYVTRNSKPIRER